MPVDDDTRGTNCMNAVDTNILVYFVRPGRAGETRESD